MLTAHYGIVLSHMRAAFGTWHYGSPEHFIVQHSRLDIVVHVVDAGYYALMAIAAAGALAHALVRAAEAAAARCARRWREEARW